MRYIDLLAKLKPFGIEQVGRWTIGADGAVHLGKPSEIVFPYQFTVHTLYVAAGVNDFYVDPEIIAAILRRFNVDHERFMMGLVD